MKQDRRRFCGTALATMATGIAAALPFAPSLSRSPLDDVAALFRHPESARRIGQRLLAHPAVPADTTTLIHRTTYLLQDLAEADGRDAGRSILRRQASQDYMSGDVILVDGWVLSRTEAHLCALLALA